MHSARRLIGPAPLYTGRMRPIALALLAVVSLLPFIASAQFDLGSSDPFTISILPANPAPGSTVTLSFLSSSIDLANSSIRVTAGGKEIYTGTVHDVSLTLGKAGSVTSVSASVTNNGKTYAQSVTIQPQDIVLVAEPVASAYALYAGKPQTPIGGQVRVVAIANVRSAGGAPVAPAALSYAWSVDGEQIPNSSGIGKSALMVASPLQYRTREVSVSVVNADGTLSGGATITLVPVEPVMRIYENDPLLGVRFDRALPDAVSMTGSEESLFAVPFSLPANAGVPLVQWFVGGAFAQSGSGITLRPAGSGAGKASLSATAAAGDAKATGDLLLTFGNTQAHNFFGL